MILVAGLSFRKHTQVIECPDCHDRITIHSARVKRVRCVHCRSYIPISRPERKFLMLSLVTMLTGLQLVLCYAWAATV